MRKYTVLFLGLVFSLAAMSQKAIISFDKKSHDFGKINENDGKASHVFEFTNTGNAPLVVNRVQASCGCTTPTWTKEPIESGKKGSITVTYNPQGRPGAFTKTITVYSNAAEEQEHLTIQGEVQVAAAVSSSDFSVTMGAVKLKSKVVQMNNVEKVKNQVRILDIQNASKTPVKPTFDNLPPYITASVVPEVLKPNDEGKVTFTFNPKKCTVWGPVSDEVYMVIDGKRNFSDDYKLTVVGNLVEDFSKLTPEQKRVAPITEVPVKTLSFGTLKEGKKKVGTFYINNKGQSPLEIRRIINNNSELQIKSKSSVNTGKSGEITVDLSTKKMAEGEYKKSFTVQTNDPENSYIVFVVSWTVKN
jgi:Protein of unknown function (DUF1573)